jgi:hypothetical protein
MGQPAAWIMENNRESPRKKTAPTLACDRGFGKPRNSTRFSMSGRIAQSCRNTLERNELEF